MDKINEQSYFSKTEQSISLKGDYAKKGNIILGHHNLKLVDKKCIVFEDIIESLDV